MDLAKHQNALQKCQRRRTLTVFQEALEHLDGDLSEAIDDVRHTTAALASHIDAITSNLEDATRNANEFSKQIRENPGVLLRGRETEE